MTDVRTRIAPSPTGFLHVGTLRTALFSYLYAKHEAGKFLVRIEDTDQFRLVEGATENIIHSLFWAAIPPDEGVTFDTNFSLTQIGESGPYIQSERLPVYKTYADQLLDRGDAFYCFCTKERLDALREMQQLNKQPTGYDGHCKTLSKEDIEKKRAAGEGYVIRLDMPDEGTSTWTDLVRGDVSFENALIDDQVLIKADGFPTYHLAVVVDDHLMNITHVFRGEEWLSSTPKHLALYKMFGWKPPVYGHVSLLVNEKKQKLSKRHGDVSVKDFEQKGYLPEAMINFVAFLGWNPGTEQELFTLEELVEAFSFEQVNKSPAVFNYEKLDWYNNQWMKRLDPRDLSVRVRPYFETAFAGKYVDLLDNETFMMHVVALGRERAKTLPEIVDLTAFLFADSLTYDAALLSWKKSTLEDAASKLAEIKEKIANIPDDIWSKEGIETHIMTWIKEIGYGVGDVLWPTRVAVSGAQFSPGPFEIMEIIGKEKTLKRIGEALSTLHS